MNLGEFINRDTAGSPDTSVCNNNNRRVSMGEVHTQSQPTSNFSLSGMARFTRTPTPNATQHVVVSSSKAPFHSLQGLPPGATVLPSSIKGTNGNIPFTIIRLPSNHNFAPHEGSNKIQPLKLRMIRPGGSGTPSSFATSGMGTALTSVNGSVPRPLIHFGSGQVQNLGTWSGSTGSPATLDLNKVAEEEPVAAKKQYYWTVYGEVVKVNEEDSMALYGSNMTMNRHVSDEMKKVYLERKGRWPPGRLSLSPQSTKHTFSGTSVVNNGHGRPVPECQVSSKLESRQRGSTPTPVITLDKDDDHLVTILDNCADGESKKIVRVSSETPKLLVKKRKRNKIPKAETDKNSKGPKKLTTASKNRLKKLGIGQVCRESVFQPQKCKIRERELRDNDDPSPCWTQVVNKHILKGPNLLEGLDRATVSEWSMTEVGDFVSKLQLLSPAEMEALLKEEVDGEALLLLDQDDLVSRLNLKLGTALKVSHALACLRHSVLDKAS